jgi:bifunctional UDP-N-acetylglucosamine pyrophosphorylase / glucosamine-1-phosphate N-acetyltransferase
MLEKNIQAIVLAAGRSTRFNTGKTKLAEKICGQEMILYATTLLETFNVPIVVVVGHNRDVVQDIITARHRSTINFVIQHEQKGTGHALLCTKDSWHNDHILIINGDMPLITADIIDQLAQKHLESNADITFVTAHNSDPSLTGYGRVVQEDHKIRIIEPKEFHGDTHEHCCINAGIYLFKKEFLVQSIEKIERSSVTQEFYLTDLIKIASDNDCSVKTVNVPFDAIRGVNDFKELWSVEQIKRSELIRYWMEHGVRFYAAQNVHIDLNVTIGAGTYISSGVHIINGSKVGNNCHIEPFSIVSNAMIAANTFVHSHSVISNSTIHESCQIGPFAHIEGNSLVNTKAVIGNFVQVKKSTIGENSKAKHLSFLGNAVIGNNVNIGAGTITCNYDGVNKNSTTIMDNTFIGSNNTLVAPVTIEQNSYTAAGSVITRDVPHTTLAIGRARQINKEGYAQKLKQKSEKNQGTSPFLAATKTNSTIIEKT